MIVLTILLTMLKWLGIILLIVLALLLVLCLCILFVPVRYHISVTCVDQWNVQGVVSWMFHILHLSFGTDGEKRTRFRIFGVPVSAGRHRGHSKRKQKKKSAKEAVKHREPSQRETERESEKTVKEISKQEMTVAKEKPIPQERDSAENKKTKMSKDEKFPRISVLRNRVKNFFLSIRGIFDRIKSVDREGLEIVRLLLINGGKLLRHILPGKIRGWVHFGTSDPAQTGEILGILSILFAMYGQGVRVVPDFDRAVLEGEVELRGSLMGIVLLILVIRIHPLQLMSYLDRK